MKGGAWRVVLLGLAVAAAALVFLAVEITQIAADDRTALVRGLAIGGVGLLALWYVFSKLARHFRDLTRLSDRLSGTRGRVDLEPWSSGRGGEIARLADVAGALLRGDGASVAGLPAGGRWERAVQAALALADDPLLVLDEQGRVERLNTGASRLLGLEQGADIGKSLLREDLARAIERARGGGAPVSAVLRRTEEGELSARVADLGLNAGVVLSFPARGSAHAAALSGRRTLSLRPSQAPGPLGDDEPLAALPFVALWVATAGPEPDVGPVIAVGTVRLVGTRIFPTVSLSLLIDPVDPVPAEAVERHGIGTAMVAGERPFGQVWPAIQDALHHCIAVGVGVDAALTVLAQSVAHAGIADPVLPPSLDLGALAAALDPALAGAPFDQLAAAFGLTHKPRLGPQAQAQAQAELAAALFARLNDRGIVTQGQARALIADRAVV
ncbi:exonuclease domain-containing protein [Azospirillum picis]|uniref:DNA polymerase-3 subunit epsilon n=1 Tax=Azospirillum picis TaxID=488438 RepID=A0ABU0MIG4_9PROT|nr:exonuclease domain-containing protein [Azospirillum picis]MBP2299618.1 DNA polymerase-3 subunit epsilon [Azospirillum picis]MDQ0533255.1 DNA polymerase-3 subunit epsilon [Azospirillum picis]